MILEYIKDNNLLIIPNNIKSKVLDSFNNEKKLINFKIMSLDELKKSMLFDYSDEVELYLMKKYNLKIDFVNTIMNDLYYIDESSNYCDDKLKFLVNIKQDLISKNMIIFDKMFLDFINKKNIIVYGYTYIDKLSHDLLNKINAKIIKEDNNYKHEVCVFNTLEEEVKYVFNEISKLISNGINLNNIKLCNVSSKYFYTIKRYSKLYSIPVKVKNNSIYSTLIVKSFLIELKSTLSFSESLSYISDNYDLSKEDNAIIYSKLLNISNKYNDINYDFSYIYELVLHDIKNTSINSNKTIEKLEITDINNNSFSESEYVFLLNFNQGEIPKLYKDEDYISDLIKEKNKLLIDLTEEKNIKSKNSCIEVIKNTKNLIITSKLKSIDSEYMISNLINDLEYEIKYPKIDFTNYYSKKLLSITLGIYLDNYIKYGIKDNNLDLLYSNTSINYLSYSNKFNGINRDKLIESLKPKLVLSYSQLSNYYNCAFKYYLSQILKIDKFEENFSTVIGSLFHYILSICFKDDFDFEKEYFKYISNLDLDKKEQFFINKLKQELKLIIENVKKLHDETGLTKLMLEHKITIDKSTIMPVYMTGIVDKIMYKEKESTLVSIVDYKTGNADINLYNVIYGLSMQLPIYLYLVKKSNLFSNVRFTGFYLQKILSSEVNYSVSKSYLEQKQSNLRLEGYSNSDMSILETFIPDYEDSKFVKSMKVSSNGFYSYSKVLNDSQINNLIEVIDKNIDNARDSILDGDFSINPKQIGNDRIGCEFCKFYDICYKTNNDYVKLEENKSLKFLEDESI